MYYILDENNYQKHRSIFPNIEVLKHDDLFVHCSNTNSNEIISICNNLVELVNKFLNIENNIEVTTIIFNGKLSSKYLNSDLVFAKSYYDDTNLIMLIVYNNLNLLERLFVHEYTHCLRLKKLNINKDKDYYKYFSVSNNWIVEEVIALTVEKYINNIDTWEKAAAFEFNKCWSKYNKRTFKYLDLSNKLKNKEIDKFTLKYENVISCMYYIVYIIAKNINCTSTLPQIFDKDTDFFVVNIIV